jgi:hypothetical protein
MFINIKGQIIEVEQIGEKLYPIRESYIASNHKIYETRIDLLYDIFLAKLKAGKPLSNYASSKYYGEYIERLKIDHPEYLI